MAGLLPEEIVCNIFARLPAKPLVRILCLSKHWNRVLRQPYFTNLRSRRTCIMLPLSEALHLINVEDTPHSERELSYPFEKLHIVSVIGTFNGIVLLSDPRNLILYNPFTRVSKRPPQPPVSMFRAGGIYGYEYGYGFGYGANTDDLKIVRFRQDTSIYDVYSFKKNRWSSWCTLKYNIKCIRFDSYVGKFLHGFLHWLAYQRNVLTVLNVKDLVLSEIQLPFEIKGRLILGTIDGCLCTLEQTSLTIFDMWVMKEYGVENSWWKKYSFTLPIIDENTPTHSAVFILDSGKILMKGPLEQVIIYDVSKDSCDTLNISLHYSRCESINCAEYVETLISPSDMRFSKFEEKKRKRKRKRKVAI